MKKIIIFVLTVAVVVLGLLVWLGKSDLLDQTQSVLQEEKRVNMEKIQDLQLKMATQNIVLYASEYYEKNSSGVFEKDADSIARISSYLAETERERNIDIEYYVHSVKTNYVVKTRVKGASNFYCLDTIMETVKPTIVESTIEFMTTNDCKGVELK